MNNKPNIPGEIFLGVEKEYSWRTDLKVNGWLMLATVISGLCDIMFPSAVRQWPLSWRVGVVLIQFLALFIWIRNLTRWIQGMDELHRRITVSAVLFAVSSTFFFVMLWHRLDAAGFFHAIFLSARHPGASWDIATVGHEALLLTFFYFLGHSIFNRDYK